MLKEQWVEVKNITEDKAPGGKSLGQPMLPQNEEDARLVRGDRKLPQKAFDVETLSKWEKETSAYRDILETHFSAVVRDSLKDSAYGQDDALISVLAGIKSDCFYALATTGFVPDTAGVGELEEVLRRQAAPRIQPQTGNQTIDLGSSLIGKGWYQHDVDAAGNPRRWSGPGHLSTIFLDALEPGDYVVSGSARFLAQDAANDFQLRITGNFKRAETMRASPSTHSFEVILRNDNEMRSNFTVIEFYCSQVILPRQVQVGNTDTRKLGFHLFNLRIKKISK